MARTGPQLEEMLPATFTTAGLTEKRFLAICAKFPDARVEYSASDEQIVVMPPSDLNTGALHAEILYQLANWSDRSGCGAVADSSVGYFLPNGSRRSPDGSLFDMALWKAAKRPGTHFPVFVPLFAIEVRSPDDRLPALEAKMQEYIENGVQLAWLIDPQRRSVTIYRPQQPPETLLDPATVEGDGPIRGFFLDLDRALKR